MNFKNYKFVINDIFFLIAYYNFRLKLKKNFKEENNNKYDNEQYYLVDKKWLKNLKVHVGYNNICQERFNIQSYNKVNDEDYNTILPLLKIFCNQNIIFPRVFINLKLSLLIKLIIFYILKC